MKWVLTIAMLLAMTGASVAQETNNLDELKKNLADALNQLKAAQDRKNELATENEGLKHKVAELEKLANDQKSKVTELEDKTWFWRSHYFGWMKFIERYPVLLAKWKVFMESEPLTLPSLLPTFDGEVASSETTQSVPTTQVETSATTLPNAP